MKTQLKRLMILTLVAMLIAPPALLADDRGFDYYEQDEPTAAEMAVDAVAIRPLGLVATVLGAGLFVVSLPFSALGGNVEEAADTLIGDPARVTFQRPLGEFDFRY